MDQLLLGALLAFVLFLFGRRMVLNARITSYLPEAVEERLKQSRDVVLLDVRTADERSRSRIDGSLHIPLSELSRRVQQLENHRRKEIICYCQTGSRSLNAAGFLLKRGFTVANMKGGIAEWNFQHR